MDTKELKRLAEAAILANESSFENQRCYVEEPSMEDVLELIAEHETLIARITELEAVAGAPDLRSAIDERAAFDTWFSGNGFAAYRESMWAAWEARAALASAAPVEALTDEEINDFWNAAMLSGQPIRLHFARAIEAQIKGRPATQQIASFSTPKGGTST